MFHLRERSPLGFRIRRHSRSWNSWGNCGNKRCLLWLQYRNGKQRLAVPRYHRRKYQCPCAASPSGSRKYLWCSYVPERAMRTPLHLWWTVYRRCWHCNIAARAAHTVDHHRCSIPDWLSAYRNIPEHFPRNIRRHNCSTPRWCIPFRNCILVRLLWYDPCHWGLSLVPFPDNFAHILHPYG